MWFSLPSCLSFSKGNLHLHYYQHSWNTINPKLLIIHFILEILQTTQCIVSLSKHAWGWLIVTNSHWDIYSFPPELTPINKQFYLWLCFAGRLFILSKLPFNINSAFEVLSYMYISILNSNSSPCVSLKTLNLKTLDSWSWQMPANQPLSTYLLLVCSLSVYGLWIFSPLCKGECKWVPVSLAMNFKRFVIIQCLIFLDISENLTCQFTGNMFVSLAEVIDSLLIGISVYSLKVCKNQRRLYLEISAWHTVCHLKNTDFPVLPGKWRVSHFNSKHYSKYGLKITFSMRCLWLFHLSRPVPICIHCYYLSPSLFPLYFNMLKSIICYLSINPSRMQQNISWMKAGFITALFITISLLL